MDVTVAVATFGARSWVRLALERAIPSARALGVPVVHHHGPTLHVARNAALESVETEWVVFLDADDELTPSYFERMAEVDADVRVPLVTYIANERPCRPRMPRVAGHYHDCTAECLPEGNWIVVGAAVRAQLVRDVGGWRDFPWSEDWDLWLRCHLAGATIAPTRAVYRAHVRPDSRNRAPDRAVKHAAHQAIARANGVPVPA
jgi:glycosyltransferase involved in cell wall biosynthesis